MKRRSPARWVRGLTLELLGVAAILWIAAGAPWPEPPETGAAQARPAPASSFFHLPRSADCPTPIGSLKDCPRCH